VPIAARCEQCRTKFDAPDEFEGRKVKCPDCKAPVEVPFGLPADDDAPASGRAASPFDFDEEPTREPRGRDDDEDDDAPKPRRAGKQYWSNLAAGLSGIQCGLAVVAVALLVLFIGPRVVTIEGAGFVGLTRFVRLILVTLLLIVISSGVSGFGHVSAGNTPNRRANVLCVTSFLASAVTMLLWMGFLGAVLYLHYLLTQEAPERELETWARASIVGFILSAAAAMLTELLFLAALKQAAGDLGAGRLEKWSLALLVILAVLLTAFLVALLIYYFTLNRESVNWCAHLIRGDYLPVQLAILGTALGFLGCYVYVLATAKEVLRNPGAFGEQQREKGRARRRH
jgi:hypothetical protein